MSEALTRIELEVNIPGPRTAEEPLEDVERIFLNRLIPGLVEKIDRGVVWQGH